MEPLFPLITIFLKLQATLLFVNTCFLSTWTLLICILVLALENDVNMCTFYLLLGQYYSTRLLGRQWVYFFHRHCCIYIFINTLMFKIHQHFVAMSNWIAIWSVIATWINKGVLAFSLINKSSLRLMSFTQISRTVFY